MVKLKFTKKIISTLLVFLTKNKRADLITTYIKYLEETYKILPIIFLPKKTIFMNVDECLNILKESDELYRKTELKVSYDKSAVNDKPQKYIYVRIQEKYLVITHTPILKMLFING